MPEIRDSSALPASASAEPRRITTGSLTVLLDLSPDALILVNQAGTIVMVNEQLEALFGYPHQELVGQQLEVLLPERLRTVHMTHRQRYGTAPRTRSMGIGLQLVGQRKDGTEVPVDISLRPLLLEDELLVIGAVRDVTEQRRLERENAQQVQQLRLQTELINLAHDAILVRDPHNRIVSWNRGAETLYGWVAQEVVGQVTHTLLQTRFPQALVLLEAALEQEGWWEGELVHSRRDGTEVIVESRWVLVREKQGKPLAILEINRDITERRRLEQAERAAHERTVAQLTFLQQVLDALPSSVYLVYGPDARLLLANRTASRLWRADWQIHQPMLEFLSTNGITLFDPQGRPLAPSDLVTLRAVRHGETVLQHQESIRYLDGSSLPVLVNAVALPALSAARVLLHEAEQRRVAGQPVALVIHQDVTVLKEAEYLKDEFVGIAAHELRTPVAALKGYTEMLLVQTARGHGPPLAQWQQEALEELNEATERLVGLTENLLDMTRLQAGRLRLQRTPTNVVPLVQQVASRLQQTTTLHQIAVHTTHVELVADIDPTRIEQVLTNLVGNAIKYSPQGGPIRITIEEEASMRAVRLSVQDRGIGIPKQHQARIFGRFMRADNAQAAGISGTGLGLYLAREFVEQHGGQLWFESEEGGGSTFFLTLPLAAAPQ